MSKITRLGIVTVNYDQSLKEAATAHHRLNSDITSEDFPAKKSGTKTYEAFLVRDLEIGREGCEASAKKEIKRLGLIAPNPIDLLAVVAKFYEECKWFFIAAIGQVWIDQKDGRRYFPVWYITNGYWGCFLQRWRLVRITGKCVSYLALREVAP